MLFSIKRRSPPNEAAADPYQDWLDLYAFLIKKMTGQNAKFDLNMINGEIDPLCFSEHFLKAQMSGLTLITTSGERIDLGSPLEFKDRNDIERVVCKVAHIEYSYYPSKDGQLEKISASGFKFDLSSADLNNSEYAALEMAKAALNMAFDAKARGWTEVDFGDTTNPFQRRLLMEACKHVGLSFGNETMFQSAVPGVTVVEPDYSQSAFINQEGLLAVSTQNNYDHKKHLEYAALHAFEEFLKSPVLPFPEAVQQPVCGLAPNTSSPPVAPSGLMAGFNLS